MICSNLLQFYNRVIDLGFGVVKANVDSVGTFGWIAAFDHENAGLVVLLNADGAFVQMNFLEDVSNPDCLHSNCI